MATTADGLADIADLLGFSTRQAFIRWFREQTGSTPGDYRRHSGAAAAPSSSA
ncbi:helix-turn-helix domain-containing protein [Acinetobacter baumannii]